jgi:hypothetical protein
MRRQAAYNIEKAKALKADRIKGFRDFDPEDLGERRLDVAKMCPAPMTARNLGKMYTVEFVEAALVSSSYALPYNLARES